jgi:hypothetical protein
LPGCCRVVAGLGCRVAGARAQVKCDVKPVDERIRILWNELPDATIQQVTPQCTRMPTNTCILVPVGVSTHLFSFTFYLSDETIPCRKHGGFRRGAGKGATQREDLERRQHAVFERRGEGSAASVGDLGESEVEHHELRQHSRRRRQRTCRRRRRSHEGGEALLSERVAHETENLQRGQPPQGRREGHQPRVADSGVRLNSNTAPSL